MTVKSSGHIVWVIIPDIIEFIIASERHSSESGGSSGSVKTPAEQNDLIARVLESSCSSGKCPAHQSNPEIDIESVKSYMSESTVSGTGLLFLRNYLKKKTALPEASNDTTLIAEDQLNSEATMVCDSHQQLVFNTVPIPFPPKNEFYGPAMFIPDDVAFCDEQEGKDSFTFENITNLSLFPIGQHTHTVLKLVGAKLKSPKSTWIFEM